MDDLTLPPGGSAPPRPRVSSLPPEVLTQIISNISDKTDSEQRWQGDFRAFTKRNAVLARLVLVNRAFQEATYSVLYGDLRLAMLANTVKRLRKSFQRNPSLLPLVFRLEATTVVRLVWCSAWADKAMEQRKGREARDKWLTEYSERYTNRNHPEWDRMYNREAKDKWDTRLRRDAEDAWTYAGHDEWWRAGKYHEEGPQILDIIGLLPSLRHLVVYEFLDALSPADVEGRGPYPLLETLETPDTSPFSVNGTLASFLASNAPNLRSLSGRAKHGPACATAIPQSLLRLTIFGYLRDNMQVAAFLLEAQPKLRSLTLQPTDDGWAISPTLVACLVSVESLTILESYHKLDLTTLSGILSSSTSLRHLEIPLASPLVPEMTALLAALPPTLASIVFTPDRGLHHHVRIRLSVATRMALVGLKQAAPRPLRVEFSNAFAGRRRALMNVKDWAPAYAAEGLVM